MRNEIVKTVDRKSIMTPATIGVHATLSFINITTPFLQLSMESCRFLTETRQAISQPAPVHRDLLGAHTDDPLTSFFSQQLA
jgi:hypothetical protein